MPVLQRVAALRRVFHREPPVANPDLVVALERVDTETQTLKATIHEHARRGTFDQFRSILNEAANKDAARVRRKRHP
jgi:hypothetical protein